MPGATASLLASQRRCKVSILSRLVCRELRGFPEYPVALYAFQSSPGWYAGSYSPHRWHIRRAPRTFQSSPGWYAGSYGRLAQTSADQQTRVSILSRLVCRELHLHDIQVAEWMLVSILSRLVCRELHLHDIQVAEWMLVSILSRLVCRELRVLVAENADRHKVSILSRLVCRELRPDRQQTGNTGIEVSILSRLVCRELLETVPAILPMPLWFQSSPGWYAGSYPNPYGIEVVKPQVSILSRLVCRELPEPLRH